MQDKYRCIIIDDEEYAVDLLVSRLLILNKNVEVIHTYTDWTNALEGLRQYECDILFLDISMRERSGMDLLKLMPGIKSEVIFVTAYSEYAINAFKLSATGYVLKPIDDVDLAQALNRAIENVQTKRLAARTIVPNAVPNKIGIPNQKSIVYVDTNDILYLEATNTYTKLVMKNEDLLCSYNLGKYKPLLPESIFYQIHRSYIVNLNYISRYENAGYIIMHNRQEIPVSKNIREEFLKLFNRVIIPSGK